MQVFHDYREVVSTRRAAVTIGNFDGVHLGHRALLARVAAVAGPSRARAVLTFEPHPRAVLCPGSAPPRLCSAKDRRELLAGAGVELLLEQRFDREFAEKSPEAFVRDVLVDGLHAAHVVVGYDFSFGARARGDRETLVALGTSHDFTVEAVGAQHADGAVASSTRVRELVRAGDLEGAASVLGRRFHLSGVVVKGAQRGRTLGFPTANLRCDATLLPATGVYAGWLDWGRGPSRAVVNIGFNPTFGDRDARTVEAHVLGRDDLDLYDRRARLFLLRRLRAELRFDGPEALRAQILMDRDRAIEALDAAPLPSWP